MSSRLLFGSDAPLPDEFGIAWVAVAGWAMGTTALGHILAPPFQPSGALGLMFCGLAPGLLSGGAAWFGSQGRGVPMRAGLTMVGSLMAALLCPPLTWLAVVASGGDTGVGHAGMGNAVAGIVVMVTIFGAFIAVPLGLAFGTVYAIALSLLTKLQLRTPSRSDLDLALIAGGVGLAVVGVACLATGAYLPAPDAGTTPAPELTAGFGLIGVLIGAGRHIGRSSFIRRATRGAIAGWEVVPATDIAGAESLPRLFAFGSADEAVLVRRETTDEGPFRSGEASTPIARC